MFDLVFETGNQEEIWWENQVAELNQGLQHHANSYAYNTDVDGFDESAQKVEDEVVKIVNDAISDLELVQNRSLYRPSDGDPSKMMFAFKCMERGLVAVIDVCSNYFGIRVWSNDKTQAREACDKIMAVVPIRDAPDPKEDMIPMAFWQHDADHGSTCFIKDIQCPSIKEISKNYPKEILKCVKELGDLKAPDELGKIIIFHGPPGTGKTYCVRALAREWANFLDSTVEIIVDPELMLNSPKYIRSILLNGDKPAEARRTINKRKGKKPVKRDGNKSPLRLIVIEDSAELFASECRSTPGFSRLLNVTDGIIGQGLRCVFLLTANEELGKIDPAIKRAGRCIQCLEFPAIPCKEANEWLREHGCSERVKEDAMLADLYAMKSAKKRTDLLTPANKFGFSIIEKE